MSIKKYIECQLADAEYEEERITDLVNNGKADDSEIVKVDAIIDAYEHILSFIRHNPDERVLWEDVGLGEKTKKGDRCYGLNGWFSMDHSHIQRLPVVVEGCYPIQRIVTK